MRKLAVLAIGFVSIGMLGACASAGKQGDLKGLERKDARKPSSDLKEVPFEQGQTVRLGDMFFASSSAIYMSDGKESEGIVRTSRVRAHSESQGWSKEKIRRLGRRLTVGGLLNLSGTVELTKKWYGTYFWLNVPNYEGLKFPLFAEISEISIPECSSGFGDAPPSFYGGLAGGSGDVHFNFQESSACEAVLKEAQKPGGLPLTLVIPDAEGDQEIYVK